MRLTVFLQLLLLFASGVGWASNKITQKHSEINPEDAKIVGSLPYSTQQQQGFEKRESYLYFTFSQASLANAQLQINSYTSDFQTSSFYIGSIDYFSRIFSFANIEGASIAKDFSLWGKYGLGLGMKQGQLQNTPNGASDSAHLVTVLAKIGPIFSYDGFDWVQPYFGVELTPFLFRHSSSLDGADLQGGGSYIEPIIGVHLPLFFEHRGSIYGELKKSYALSDAQAIFQSNLGFSAGLGYAF